MGLLEGLAVALGAAIAGLHGAVVAAACLCLLAPVARSTCVSPSRARSKPASPRPTFVRQPLGWSGCTRSSSPSPVRTARRPPRATSPISSGAAKDTLASPRSYNNRGRLVARTINEHLGAGTEVLVAEMGAYGAGEIAGALHWMPPEIAVITAIGPAHLERFKSLDAPGGEGGDRREGRHVVVLNVDDPRFAPGQARS